MVFAQLTMGFAALAGLSLADPISCDFSAYQPQEGLSAEMEGETLTLAWEGRGGIDLRLRLEVDNGQPVIKELATRSGGSWNSVATDLVPEFHVTTGKRRISNQQLNPLKELGTEVTPGLFEREKWKVFWDAPLNVPGLDGVNPDLPRQLAEIRRDRASYRISGCRVTTEGARLAVSMDGVSLGIFSGRLQFSVYRGTNLIRQEVIARTSQPSVAYKYRAGWKGFPTQPQARVRWRDTSRAWQKYEFGGSPNREPVPLRARSRVAVVELEGGSIAVFPPPHKFFWAREIDMNLGFVWYRKDDEDSFSVGVRHADREEMFRPYGVSDELWEKRVRQSRRFALGNFALYNAPPGTWQRMAAYFYVSPDNGRATHAQVMEFTHNDRYQPLDGYQVAINHFHTHFGEQLADAGTLDMRPPWIPAFRALGINIAMMSDFHGDGHANDPGPLRLQDQHRYFEGCRRHSDRDFLIIPGEEPNAYLGGHYNMIFPKPVFWTKVRQEGQNLVEDHPSYGTVYHTGSTEDVLAMLRREGGLVWQAHPRTKGSTGYPDAVRHKPPFLSDRFLGAAFQSLPVDLSEHRICQARCFDLLDDMNNWTEPKYLVADGDTYTKFPDDEIYPQLIVNYVKVGQLPSFDESWTPITDALRRGEFFVTSGEVLIPHQAVQENGAQSLVVADVEWTFPLEFVELVFGDGKGIGRRVVPATGHPPFGEHRFEIPFDATGVKWVRFAAWDSAGNGAFTQPVHLAKGP